MRARTWNLRLNLDDFNAAFAVLADDVERGQFLGGMSIGMNSGTARPSAPDPLLEGYALGKAMRDEAEAYRQSQAVKGSKGGRPPLKTRGEPSGLPGLNHLVNQDVTTAEPQLNPIHNPQSGSNGPPLTPSHPGRALARGRLDSGMPIVGTRTTPEPAPALDLHTPAPAQVSPTVDLDDFGHPLVEFDDIPLAQDFRGRR
jgi:hypothetical protein